jgi:hypothetical protein
MVLHRGIGKPSAVLKNSSETIKFDSGLKSELAVVRLLQNRKYICEFHRFKTKLAEIDIISFAEA